MPHLEEGLLAAWVSDRDDVCPLNRFRGRPFTPTLCATCFGQNRSLKIGEGAWPHRTRTRSTQVYTSLSCLSQPRCIKSGASQGASNQVPAKVHQIDSLEIRVDECKRQVGRMVADLRLVICMPERLGQRIPRHGSATGCPTCCIPDTFHCVHI